MELEQLSSRRKKKAAIELGVGTMVILVVAVVLLILALIFVRRIFVGATYNVDRLNDAVRNEINKLFKQEGQRIALYLPGNTAEVEQEETFGVAFGIRNTEPTSGTFSYQVTPSALNDNCVGITAEEAAKWVFPKSEEFPVPSGNFGYKIVKVNAPSYAPVGCQVVYQIEVKKDGRDYDSTSFFAEIKAKGFG